MLSTPFRTHGRCDLLFTSIPFDPLQDMREHHTDTSVHFDLALTPEGAQACQSEGLVKRFKLTSSFSTGNMNLFDEEGRITKYESPEQSK